MHVQILAWSYLKVVSSLTSLHYLWRLLSPFSLPCAIIIIIINTHIPICLNLLSDMDVVSNTIEEVRNRSGAIGMILAQGLQSLMVMYMAIVGALHRRVPDSIFLEFGVYSGLLTLEPLDNLPDWRVMMSYHIEKLVSPPFTDIVCMMAVG